MPPNWCITKRCTRHTPLRASCFSQSILGLIWNLLNTDEVSFWMVGKILSVCLLLCQIVHMSTTDFICHVPSHSNRHIGEPPGSLFIYLHRFASLLPQLGSGPSSTDFLTQECKSDLVLTWDHYYPIYLQPLPHYLKREEDNFPNWSFMIITIKEFVCINLEQWWRTF